MHRTERLAEALKDEIAEVVGFELEDPRVEAVTVTDVKVSDDLRDAKVYVLAVGTDADSDVIGLRTAEQGGLWCAKPRLSPCRSTPRTSHHRIRDGSNPDSHAPTVARSTSAERLGAPSPGILMPD